MDNDLEAHEVQLSQVELALAKTPDDAELQDLAAGLRELIELTKAAQAQAQAAQAKPEPTRKASQAGSSGTSGKTWAAGDECLAKYSSDGNWYPARITSVGGAADNRVFSIVFKGYNTTELVKAHELKALTASYLSGPGPYSGGSGGSGGAGSKRKLSKEEEEERERKKKKNEKKLELRATKAKEQNEKKATWQKFAKKSEKKGIHIAGVAGTSIFKTPDNPLGKGGDFVRMCFIFVFWI